jgi:urease accessory protein
MNFMPKRQAQGAIAQRAKGALALAFKRAGGQTRIDRLYQEGCLKARLPRPQDPATCEAVTMNISGGIAGGDRLEIAVEAGPGTRLVIASQAAERIYRALAEPAAITTKLTVHAGAHLDYLPQETILFDGFALARRLDIDLQPEASFLGIESLVFGRHAMGERVTRGHLRDRITLTRGGRRILQDMTRLEGDIDAQLRRPAAANGAGATATLILATPDAPARLADLRTALAGAHAGATSYEGIVTARILAPDGFSLRNILRTALAAIRSDQALPKVWQG